MKAIVLAAGRGDRMQPLTRFLAVPALPFLNRPLIHYALDRAAQAGVSQVGVNLHHIPGSVQEALTSWDGPPLDFFISRETELQGTGGALAGFSEWLAADPVLILHGDLIVDFDARHLAMAAATQQANAALLTRENRDAFKMATVIVDAERRIRQIAGKPPTAGLPAGDSKAAAGACFMAPGMMKIYSRAEKSDLYSDVLPKLIGDRRKLIELPLTSPFYADPATRRNYLGATGAALRAMAANKWPLRAAANSKLRKHGEALLYSDSSAKYNADILRLTGFAVFGAESQLLGDCSITNCVILPGVRVGGGAVLENCIVAPNVRVPNNAVIRDEIVI